MAVIQLDITELSDVVQVFHQRGLEVCYSVENDAVYLYGSDSELAEIEHIIWAAQVVDGLAAVLVNANFSEREGAFCRIEG